MRHFAIPVILLGYVITVTTCEQAYGTKSNPNDVDKFNFLKRMDRRAYTYMTGSPGSKRLPNYNFGLGKRARYLSILKILYFFDFVVVHQIQTYAIIISAY